MTNDEAIAELTEEGSQLRDYFFLGERGEQLVAFWHPHNGVMVCMIDDGGVSRAYKRVLRKQGAREFRSSSEVYKVACQERWPNWEKFQHEAQSPKAMRGRPPGRKTKRKTKRGNRKGPQLD